jgi:trehalose synthase-fused probable maltokinase
MGSKARSSEARERPGLPRTPALAEAATRSLPAWLPHQRWFGAKARTITEASLVDAAVLPGTSGVLAVFRVGFTTGEPETYFVPLRPRARRAGAEAVQDALDDPEFSLALVAGMRQGGTLPATHGTVRCAASAALAEVLPEPPGTVTRVRGEQSNSSLIFGKAAILKLFRKLEAGPNPEFELTDFLTRQTAFRAAPRLLGAITLETPGQEPVTLAVLQEFVPSQGDAWTVTLGRLAEYYAAVLSSPEEGDHQALARAMAAADAKEARDLGALTGQLHMALASAASDPFLAPDPIAPADVAAWQEAMQQRLDRVVADLTAALERLPAGVQAVARAVLEEAPRAREGLTALQALGTEPVTKIRVHGDYHLGQVLKTADGFVILDFEGEPARPLPERRAKQCALKDVAGMLRSFAYAARSAALRAAEARPEEPDRLARLLPSAEAWEEGVRTAFLEGYLAETWERGAPFLPRRREALEAVLRVFELDKTIYELHYELNNRPTWLQIPLDGLRRAVAAPSRVEPAALRPGEGPFHFVACLELREFVGVRAENERQLAQLIEEVPLDSVYYHTHGFFLRHKFVAGIYHNDFATWAAVEVRDRVLGERLAMVDPAEFPNLQALREELVAVIDDHLRGLQIVPGVIFGEPFDFIQSRIVEIPLPLETRTLQEFRDALLELDPSAIYFHLVEARMRLGRGQNDFAAWLEHGLGLPRLAARVRAVDPYAGSLERTRARLIQLCDEALAEEGGR